MYFSICYVYISLWPLMGNFPFCCVEGILPLFFSLILTQQFEAGLVVFLAANYLGTLPWESGF